METQAPLRILGVTAYPETAASARVRIAQFGPFLSSYGVDLIFEPALRPDEYAILSSSARATHKARILGASALRAAIRGGSDELLLVHRLRLLNPLPFIDPPRRLDIYDFDDALFLGSAAAVNQRFQWSKQERRRALACVRRARLVIAGNAFLADHARRYSRHVEVVPSCVDPSSQNVRRHENAEVVTIGWIGSHTTSQYLEPILPVISRINANGLRARLVVIGGALNVRLPWLEQRSWSLHRQADDLAGFDIGIMPLPNTDWARGKCGYKLLQYFAAGVPAVASPVGVSSQLLGDDRGILASTSSEWQNALEQLIHSADDRAQRGAAARSFAQREYSYARWAPELAGMLRQLA